MDSNNNNNNDKEKESLILKKEKTKEKSNTSLLGVYKFFHDSLKMKNQICRWFLFKPPSPRGRQY